MIVQNEPLPSLDWRTYCVQLIACLRLMRLNRELIVVVRQQPMYGPHNVLPYLVANFKDALSEQCTAVCFRISFIVKIWVCRVIFLLQCLISDDEFLMLLQ